MPRLLTLQLMRILHLCTSIDPTTGGPANVLARLAPAQVARNHLVSIVTADPLSSVADVAGSLTRAGVSLHVGGPASGPFSKGPQVDALIRAALDRGEDLVHIHGLWQHTPHHGARLCRSRRIPYVFRPCGMLDPWSLRQGALRKKAFLLLGGRRDLNRAAALHFTSAAERDLASPLRLAPVPHVIPNGIDWEEFASLPTAGAFRSRFGIGDRPLVTFFSRLHHKKGLDILLPAFASLEETTAFLALVGPGDAAYVAELKKRAVALGVVDRVIFVGMLKGRDRLEPLVDADLFCLPSYQENFGVAVIEALACGTPALISDQVNICSEVVAAGAGRSVPCQMEAVGEALHAMLADRPALKKMGAAARQWVSTTFPWPAIARRIDEMYESCLDR